MGCNVQFIFYRNKKGDTLVKLLLNEEEIALPKQIDDSLAPYYRWEDVNKFYRDLIPQMYETGGYNRLDKLLGK